MVRLANRHASDEGSAGGCAALFSLRCGGGEGEGTAASMIQFLEDMRTPLAPACGADGETRREPGLGQGRHSSEDVLDVPAP